MYRSHFRARKVEDKGMNIEDNGKEKKIRRRGY
jgi:hypothetical protein